MTTLQTGCGASTIVLAAAGARHVTISPDAGEHRHLLAPCAEPDIATDGVRFLRASASWEQEP